MLSMVPLEPVDYLVIGHLTEDVTPAGLRLGGTAAFAALTARAFGMRVGIVTSVSDETALEPLHGIPVLRVPAARTTTFENLHTDAGRRQVIRHRASDITTEGLPEAWKKSAIVHLGPVAQEISSEAAEGFPASLLGITPQGWMRTWDAEGNVTPCVWKTAGEVMRRAGAVVISREDVHGDEDAIHGMSQQTRVLAVTDGANGVVLYWNGDSRRFRPPPVSEVDPVGAGDVFAAAFFIRLYTTRDPWEAARFATLLAARSVTRPGLEGIPTSSDIDACSMEVMR
ncbi:MAG TPA: PfkB family carbohydrate kinase [Anaerolineales bacterium]|nr:PfkB family carbohydrate kinase [Anaerolineales bacterium]